VIRIHEIPRKAVEGGSTATQGVLKTVRRNLLFHLYPKRESLWRWHVEQLLKYRSAWNGRRLIQIVLDRETDGLVEVERALAPLEAEISVGKNDWELNEMPFFLENLEKLQSLDLDEATFYAHGKGVRHAGKALRRVQSWSKAMYILNLESIEAIERALRRTPAVGCFRHYIQHGGARWCYAGTFFWIRHVDLFSRNWRRINKSRYGVESYPGLHFRWEELGVLTPDNVGPNYLYGGFVNDERIQEWKIYWEDRMHPSVIDFLRRSIRSEEISGKELLEVGSYNVNGTPRSVFDGMAPKQYLGVDTQSGPCVDRVVAVNDLVKEFGQDRFDVVVSTEMLEHVRDWRRAVAQMKAVTRPGGLLVITTRSPGFPYHPYPEDHWRFTIEHFREIFADMTVEVLDSDVPSHPGVLLKARKKEPGLSTLSLEKIVPAPPR
jgi:hypothetical protein